MGIFPYGKEKAFTGGRHVAHMGKRVFTHIPKTVSLGPGGSSRLKWESSGQMASAHDSASYPHTHMGIVPYGKEKAFVAAQHLAHMG